MSLEGSYCLAESKRTKPWGSLEFNTNGHQMALNQKTCATENGMRQDSENRICLIPQDDYPYLKCSESFALEMSVLCSRQV